LVWYGDGRFCMLRCLFRDENVDASEWLRSDPPRRYG